MAFGNGYGGYGGFGVSPYGPLGGSLPTPPPYMYPGMMPGAPGQDQFIGSGHKKKKQGLTGFFQGIYNGAANMIKGMFTLPGIAMTAATAGLVWATGGAALIPLAAIGAGIGGFQMLKGIGQGSAEGFGEGVFTTAASLLGLKFTPKTVKMDGKTFTLGNPNEKLGLLGRFKSMWGGEKYQSGDDVLHMGQMFREKITRRFPSKSGENTLPNANPGNLNAQAQPKPSEPALTQANLERHNKQTQTSPPPSIEEWVTASQGRSDTASVISSRSNSSASSTGNTKFSDARTHIGDDIQNVSGISKQQTGWRDWLPWNKKEPKIKTD